MTDSKGAASAAPIITNRREACALYEVESGPCPYCGHAKDRHPFVALPEGASEREDGK